MNQIPWFLDPAAVPAQNPCPDEALPIWEKQRLWGMCNRHADNTLQSLYVQEMVLGHLLRKWQCFSAQRRRGIFTRFNTNQDTSKAHSTSSQLPLALRRPSPETRATEFGSEARKGLRSQFRPGLVPNAQVRLVHAEGSS